MLLFSIAVSALAVGLISLTLIIAFKNKHTSDVADVHQKLKECAEQVHILRSEAAELRTGLLSIGKRVLEVEQQNQLGADLDEVIRECELPRAEAELLFSLHKKKGA